MTTEPVDTFPIGLLQKSYKVVIEPPSTLKLNLRSTFLNLSQQTFNESSHPAYPCLIYILAFFHAIILERRKYEKIGWSCSYDFNESDCERFLFVLYLETLFSSFLVRVSVEILKTYLKTSVEHENLEIPWPTLQYLIGEGKDSCVS